MVKIYNIKSSTMTEKAFKGLSENRDIFLLNEDFQCEIIDTDSMTVLKTKKPIKWLDIFKRLKVDKK